MPENNIPEKKKKQLSDDTVIIGNKPEFIYDAKTNQTISTEPYLRPILQKIVNYGYINIKLLPHTDKMAKVSQMYEMLKWFGIREIYGSRKFIMEQDWSNPKSDEKVKVLLIRWVMIERLKKYKEELMAEMK